MSIKFDTFMANLAKAASKLKTEFLALVRTSSIFKKAVIGFISLLAGALVMGIGSRATAGTSDTGVDPSMYGVGGSVVQQASDPLVPVSMYAVGGIIAFTGAMWGLYKMLKGTRISAGLAEFGGHLKSFGIVFKLIGLAMIAAGTLPLAIIGVKKYLGFMEGMDHTWYGMPEQNPFSTGTDSKRIPYQGPYAERDDSSIKDRFKNAGAIMLGVLFGGASILGGMIAERIYKGPPQSAATARGTAMVPYRDFEVMKFTGAVKESTKSMNNMRSVLGKLGAGFAILHSFVSRINPILALFSVLVSTISGIYFDSSLLTYLGILGGTVFVVTRYLSQLGILLSGLIGIVAFLSLNFSGAFDAVEVFVKYIQRMFGGGRKLTKEIDPESGDVVYEFNKVAETVRWAVPKVVDNIINSVAWVLTGLSVLFFGPVRSLMFMLTSGIKSFLLFGDPSKKTSKLGKAMSGPFRAFTQKDDKFQRPDLHRTARRHASLSAYWLPEIFGGQGVKQTLKASGEFFRNFTAAIITGFSSMVKGILVWARANPWIALLTSLFVIWTYAQQRDAYKMKRSMDIAGPDKDFVSPKGTIDNILTQKRRDQFAIDYRFNNAGLEDLRSSTSARFNMNALSEANRGRLINTLEEFEEAVKAASESIKETGRATKQQVALVNRLQRSIERQLDYSKLSIPVKKIATDMALTTASLMKSLGFDRGRIWETLGVDPIRGYGFGTTVQPGPFNFDNSNLAYRIDQSPERAIQDMINSIDDILEAGSKSGVEKSMSKFDRALLQSQRSLMNLTRSIIVMDSFMDGYGGLPDTMKGTLDNFYKYQTSWSALMSETKNVIVDQRFENLKRLKGGEFPEKPFTDKEAFVEVLRGKENRQLVSTFLKSAKALTPVQGRKNYLDMDFDPFGRELPEIQIPNAFLETTLDRDVFVEYTRALLSKSDEALKSVEQYNPFKQKTQFEINAEKTWELTHKKRMEAYNFEVANLNRQKYLETQRATGVGEKSTMLPAAPVKYSPPADGAVGRLARDTWNYAKEAARKPFERGTAEGASNWGSILGEEFAKRMRQAPPIDKDSVNFLREEFPRVFNAALDNIATSFFKLGRLTEAQIDFLDSIELGLPKEYEAFTKVAGEQHVLFTKLSESFEGMFRKDFKIEAFLKMPKQDRSLLTDILPDLYKEKGQIHLESRFNVLFSPDDHFGDLGVQNFEDTRFMQTRRGVLDSQVQFALEGFKGDLKDFNSEFNRTLDQNKIDVSFKNIKINHRTAPLFDVMAGEAIELNMAIGRTTDPAIRDILKSQQLVVELSLLQFEGDPVERIRQMAETLNLDPNVHSDLPSYMVEERSAAFNRLSTDLADNQLNFNAGLIDAEEAIRRNVFLTTMWYSEAMSVKETMDNLASSMGSNISAVDLVGLSPELTETLVAYRNELQALTDLTGTDAFWTMFTGQEQQEAINRIDQLDFALRSAGNTLDNR